MVFKPIIKIVIFVLLLSNKLFSGGIYISSATIDITPSLPVAVDGQMHLRITDTIETPLEAGVLVVESRSNDKSLNTVVFVSCDLVTIPLELRDEIRRKTREKILGFEVEKIIISATHTHTGPVVRDKWYLIPEGVTQPNEYIDNISDRISEGIANAWRERKPGNMSWGISEAKVAFNRRAVYSDGSAQMYGKTDTPDFRGIEGYEDQDVNTMFFWGENGKIIATCINVASPAQVVEGRTAINADYWHPVREGLRKHFGENLTVLCWIGAAGDQTPRPMYGSAALERMFKLQGIENTKTNDDHYLQFIASKLVEAVIETYEIIKKDRHFEVKFEHKTETLFLPMRIVDKTDYDFSKRMIEKDLVDADNAEKYNRRIVWHQEVLDRFEYQKINPDPKYRMDFNILRIGDIAICTNSFELFTDFGVQIKARSKALQTFIIQLAGPGTYLPTERATKGGHYSAIVQSNRVGPEGGHELVERTLDIINSMWE